MGGELRNICRQRVVGNRRGCLVSEQLDLALKRHGGMMVALKVFREDVVEHRECGLDELRLMGRRLERRRRWPARAQSTAMAGGDDEDDAEAAAAVVRGVWSAIFWS